MTAEAHSEQIGNLLKQYWGFDSLRPLQREVVNSACQGEDALVVMPTGGGKSLCFQLPALIVPGLTLVVSPLIALMKDQVDALTFIGYPAAALNSSLSSEETKKIMEDVRSGRTRLLYVSPERLASAGFAASLAEADGGRGVSRIAIDEAHCISQWGHDFRPEYRQIGTLRAAFPGVSVHAFTATATPKVRADIAAQLRLVDARELIGTFDRPNLTYRIIPKQNRMATISEAIRRHPNDAVLIYCISRKNTEELARELAAAGFRAEAYHAGLSNDERRRISEAFAQERVNVVVATVAFGMGIDRANVRCVIHESMPKSIEGYTQETGRAGRDGLPSECIMLYNHGDIVRWKSVLELNPSAHTAHQIALLEEVRRFAIGFQCRHKSLSNYFGQEFPDRCEACDICLDGVQEAENSTKTAHRILATAHDMLRTDARFGVQALVKVLAGANVAEVKRFRWDQLRGYGCLKTVARERIQSYIYQLLDLDLLAVTEGKFPILQATGAGLGTLREKRDVMLRETHLVPAARSKRSGASGALGALFEDLRAYRRDLAAERGVPAYVICHDAVLQQISRRRPATMEELGQIGGMGARRLEDIGAGLLAVVQRHQKPQRVHAADEQFRAGMSIEEAAAAIGRAPSTVAGYLADWILAHPDADISTWIANADRDRVWEVADRVGNDRLRPIKDELDDLDYEQIRAALAHGLATGRLVPTIREEA